MKTITIETARSVGEDFNGEWLEAEDFKPSEREFRTMLKSDLAEAGINPRRSREFKFKPRSVQFVEFDSGNVGHASAYYAARFTGPDELVKKILENL